MLSLFRIINKKYLSNENTMFLMIKMPSLSKHIYRFNAVTHTTDVALEIGGKGEENVLVLQLSTVGEGWN